jgi:outer membrane protein assembly factor BamB
LTKAAELSLPLLTRLLASHDPDVRTAAFDIAYRIGPPAIGLLTQMLNDPRVDTRRQVVDILIDLAPDTESIQPALCRALKDPDAGVAADAGRALGALAQRAAPSVPALVEALANCDTHVRLYAAESLASIGAPAAPATLALAALLHDPIPGVRWAACEGLASIGPAAARAVPQLIAALGDESLYVRICAAGALGSIGPDAMAALTALREAAAKDPALRAEAEWARDRISGTANGPATTVTPTAAATQTNPRTDDDPRPTTTPSAANLPLDWDTSTGRNIAWSVPLGGETFGRPVVAGDAVYIGTDNARKLNPVITGACGVLLALRAADGAFRWQDAAPPRPERGLREFLLPSTTSAPHVEGDRLYYLTAQCQLRCLDIHAPPHTTVPNIIWELDLCATLGVFPHEACNSDVLPLGDLLIVSTSNGRNEAHTRVPSPRAPSLIAVDKRTGQVVWRAVGAGANVLHGQWCSPTAATINGRTQILFGGGDGWLRAYDVGGSGRGRGGRELWRFDGNPKDAPWRPRPGALSRCSIVASPVYDDHGGGRVFLAMGEDPSHGNGPAWLHAISPNGHGDVTDSRRLWTCTKVGRMVATPILHEGLLYAADIGGTVHCLDADTGEVLWKHDTQGDIWGCLFLAGGSGDSGERGGGGGNGGRLYAGNVNGTMTAFRPGRQKQVLAEIEMDAPLYSRPALAGDTMYLATARRLYLIKSADPKTKPATDR